MRRGLAELHLHLYGTIRAADYLRFVAQRDVDWTFYERAYEEAYGSAPPVREILERHRAGDPTAARDWEKLFVFGDDDAGDFDRFQAKFNLLIAGSHILPFAMGADVVEDLVREVEFFVRAMREDQRRQGITYAEQRLLLGPEISGERAEHLIEALLRDYRAASRDGATERLAISLPREDPWDDWERVSRLALGPHGDALTGVDFCFVEEGHPPKDQAGFFSAVRDFNERHPERALAILYHVGESFRDKSLESAARWVQEAAELGAHRLGHAIALGVDPESYGPHTREESRDERLDQIAYDLAHADGLARHGVRVDRAALERERRALEAGPADASVSHRCDAARLDEVRRRQDYAMERVRATGAVIEVCPTSNRRIGGIGDPDHHPVHRFLEHDLPVVVASDDPGIFGTTLEAELDWVAEAAGLDPEARRALEERAWSVRSEVLTGRERSER